MPRTFTFNKPLAALLALPLLILLVFTAISFWYDRSAWKVIAFALSLFFFIGAVWLTLLRRLTIAEGSATWKTPRVRYSIPFAEVKCWGKVRFRSYDFIFLSRSESNPFEGAEGYVVTTQDTFVIQMRPAAWDLLKEQMGKYKPGLEALAVEKR